jgi:hypothetical protein
MRSSQLVLLALAVACADAALAQKIGRYVFPDGRVVYSDQPVPGARLANEVAPPPPPGSPPPVSESREGRPAKSGETPGAARSRTLAEADAEVRAATQALEQARARQQAGVEPLPGERTGTAKGGSRLNEAYEARQAANQQAVAAAEARLQRAVAARNAVR